MIVRVLLLGLGVVSAGIAAILGFQWGWFGIDPSARLYAGWLAASIMFTSASWLPWGVWLTRP